MFVVASQSVMLIVLPRRSLRGAYATSQSICSSSCCKSIYCSRSKTSLRAGGL